MKYILKGILYFVWWLCLIPLLLLDKILKFVVVLQVLWHFEFKKVFLDIFEDHHICLLIVILEFKTLKDVFAFNYESVRFSLDI